MLVAPASFKTDLQIITVNELSYNINFQPNLFKIVLPFNLKYCLTFLLDITYNQNPLFSELNVIANNQDTLVK